MYILRLRTAVAWLSLMNWSQIAVLNHTFLLLYSLLFSLVVSNLPVGSMSCLVTCYIEDVYHHTAYYIALLYHIFW